MRCCVLAYLVRRTSGENAQDVPLLQGIGLEIVL
jgi:hypothetical protein